MFKVNENFANLPGSSMEDAQIDDGDLVIIRQQHTAQIGEIVVAVDRDGIVRRRYFAGENAVNGIKL